MTVPPAPPTLTKAISPSEIYDILDHRKSLPSNSYSYKLMGTPSTGGSYGLDVSILEDSDINEAEMSMTILYADGNNRDGVGDLLEVGGIDTQRHRKAPHILFDHGKQCVLPIALAEEPQTQLYTNFIDVNSKKASVRAYFYQGGKTPNLANWDQKDGDIKSLLADPSKEYNHAVFCNQIFDLAAKRFIRGGSIGYQVKRAVNLPADFERGTPSGLHLLSTLMLEASLVVMPANMDTVTKKALNYVPEIELAREVLSMRTVCGKPLSPYLVKSLSPMAERNTRVVSGYEGKGIKDTAKEVIRVAKDALHPKKILGDAVAGVAGSGPVAALMSHALGTSLSDTAIAGGVGAGSTVAYGIGQRIANRNKVRNQKLASQREKIHKDKIRKTDKLVEKYEGSGAQELSHFSPSKTTNLPHIESVRAKSMIINVGGKPTQVDSSTPGSVEAPLEKLPDTQIPPSNWKPGAGAKSLRDKYRKKGNVGRAAGAAAGRVVGRAAGEYLGGKVGAGKVGGRVGGAAGTAAGAYAGGKLEDAARDYVKPKSKAMSSLNNNTGGALVGSKSCAECANGSLCKNCAAMKNKDLESRLIKKKSSVGEMEDLHKSGVSKGQKAATIHRPGADKPVDTSAGRVAEPLQTARFMPKMPTSPQVLPSGAPQPEGTQIKPRQKNFDAVRKKYRSVKTLRRKVKGGRTGSVTMRIRSKDFDKLEAAAKAKGVKCNHLGIKDGLAKIKLMGPDESMDELAKDLGVSHRVFGRKSLPAQEQRALDPPSTLPDGRQLQSIGGMDEELLEARRKIGEVRDLKRGGGGKQSTKNLNSEEDIKHMKYGTKAAPDLAAPDIDDVAGEPPIDDLEGADDMGMDDMGEVAGDTVGEHEQLEKYSAQVLRRLHRDNILLLEQYDEIAEMLEHEDIGNHLRNKLEGLTAELDQIELLMEKHHPGAGPFDGAMDDEMGGGMGPEVGEPDMDVEEDLNEEPLEGGEGEIEGPDATIGDDEMGPEGEEDEAERIKDSVPEEDQDAIPADSDEEELPEPEEAIEGMETKDLKRRLIKALRKNYSGSRSMGIGDGPKESKPGAEATKQELKDKNAVMDVRKRERDVDTVAGMPGKKSVKTCEDCGYNPCQCCGKKALHKGDLEDGQNVEVKDLDVPESTTVHEKPDTSKVNPIQHEVDEGLKPLEKHECDSVREAQQFLDSLKKETNYNNDHKMAAFHHAESLKKIASSGGEDFNVKHIKDILGIEAPEGPSISEALKKRFKKAFSEMNKEVNAVHVTDPSGYKPKLGNEPAQQFGGSSLVRKKNIDGVEVEIEGEGDDFQDDRSYHHHRNAIGSAQKFLAKLAKTNDFGEPHRQECLIHSMALSDASRALDPAMQEAIDTADVNMPDSNEQLVPGGEISHEDIGDVGEKGVSLVDKPKKKFKEADKEIIAVDVNHPKSPTKAKLGNEPAQKFGKKEEKSMEKKEKVAPLVAAAVPAVAGAVGGMIGGDKEIKKKSLDDHVTKQRFARQNEQISELTRQIQQLTSIVGGESK